MVPELRQTGDLGELDEGYTSSVTSVSGALVQVSTRPSSVWWETSPPSSFTAHSRQLPTVQL